MPEAITRNAEVMHGTPVFRGTRTWSMETLLTTSWRDFLPSAANSRSKYSRSLRNFASLEYDAATV